MDATRAIQDSIHVFSLVRKYVSRILGTYQAIMFCLLYNLLITFSYKYKYKFLALILTSKWQYKNFVYFQFVCLLLSLSIRPK